jgi:broad specificity phosphatase PhoE
VISAEIPPPQPAGVRSVARVVLHVVVVQHGQKEPIPGDPGLTALGRAQASTTADCLLAHEAPIAIWSSPLRRAAETAAPMAERVGLDVVSDPRLRERMNWEGPPVDSHDEFVMEWQRSSTDRSYVPRGGDSSEQAAERFLSCLADLLDRHPSGLAVVVAHGGVTVDVLRSLLGDERLMNDAPTIIEEGVPSCALTALHHDGGRWIVDHLPTDAHL